jgi:chromosome segregation ATPase
LAGLCLAVLAFAILPAGSQQENQVNDLAGINRSLERMVVLLETMIDNQDTDILLRRIELKERRLIPLESELRRAERSLLDMQSRLKMIQEELEQQEEQLSEEMRQGIDPQDSDARRAREQMERILETENSRAEEFERRVRMLQDELAEGQDEIAILDEQLQELLQQ